MTTEEGLVALGFMAIGMAVVFLKRDDVGRRGLQKVQAWWDVSEVKPRVLPSIFSVIVALLLLNGARGSFLEVLDSQTMWKAILFGALCALQSAWFAVVAFGESRLWISHALTRVKVRRLNWASLAIFAALIVVGATLAWTVSLASDQVKAKDGLIASAFERTPRDWLDHPAEVTTFFSDMRAGRLHVVAISMKSTGTKLLYTLKDGSKHSTSVPGCTTFFCPALKDLLERGADNGFSLAAIEASPVGGSDWPGGWFDKLISVLPWLLAIAVAYHVFSTTRKEHGEVASLAERPDVRLHDVVGAAEAKAALRRVVRFMDDPSSYLTVGARPPHGVLLKGPPGTGKTLLARALAGEIGANFIAIDGSYFTSMFFGIGVMKVSSLFAKARKMSPCIIFIDEIDGIGRRGSSDGHSGANEQNRIINRILVEMDGFADEERVIVIGATNNEENLEPALRRAGRFDLTVGVDLPTVLERSELFALYAKRVSAADDIDTEVLGRMTSGMSPADIANAVNKAASSAAEQGLDAVTQALLLKAVEDFQLGGEVSALKSVLTEGTRRKLAYHEAGHALVGHRMSAGSVQRVSIEPRGGALGATYITRETEEPLYGKQELTGRLAMLLAGREAELLKFDDVSTGAADDLKRASELAVSMVSTMGFSSSIGLLSVAGLPKELVSPQTKEQLLQEARALLSEAQRTAREVLDGSRATLEALAEALLLRDVLSGPELVEMLSHGPVGASRGRLATPRSP